MDADLQTRRVGSGSGQSFDFSSKFSVIFSRKYASSLVSNLAHISGWLWVRLSTDLLGHGSGMTRQHSGLVQAGRDKLGNINGFCPILLPNK